MTSPRRATNQRLAMVAARVPVQPLGTLRASAKLVAEQALLSLLLTVTV